MHFPLRLAWSYFRARRKSLARFTALVAVIGVAGGVASLVTADALARGFQSEMQDKILSNTPHVTIFNMAGDEISDWPALKDKLEKIDNIKTVYPTSYQSALIVSGQSTGYAVLRVVENQKWQAADNANISVAVGAALAEKTALKIGDETEIVLPVSQNEFAPRTVRAVVRDIFRTGLYDYDSTWVYISLADLGKISGRSNISPSAIGITVDDIYTANRTAEKIRKILPEGFKVLDWQETNQPLFAALSLEKRVAIAIISLIIFIAALNITTTLTLLVNERRLDIAVLRTCGAKGRDIVAVFLFEGIFLGAAGIAAGWIIGLAACWMGTRFHAISLPTEIYALNNVPLTVDFYDFFITGLIAFGLCLAATMYPAWRAAKVKPLENLRNQ